MPIDDEFRNDDARAACLAATRSLTEHLQAGDPVPEALERSFLAASWGAQRAYSLWLSRGGAGRARVSDILADASGSETVRQVLRGAEDRGELLEGLGELERVLVGA